jgi:mutator protein MutT
MKAKKNKPHLQVAAAIIWKKGRVLVTKRPKGSHMEGFWEFPGGKKEQNEGLRACLEREIIEELNIRVKAEKPLLSVDHEYETRHVTLHFFQCRVIEGEPEPLGCEEIKWAKPEDLVRFRFPPPDRELVEALSGGAYCAEKRQDMFYKHDLSGYKQALEGIELKTLVYGDKTLLSEFRLKKGRTLPLHSHPHEQTGYVVSGKITLIMGEKRYEAEPGDSWSIPGGMEHGAEVIENAVVVEVFSPVREDYLP